MWAGSRPDGLVAVKVRCVRAVRRSLHATPASARACCRPKRACWLARAPWHLAGLHDVQKTLQLHDLLRKHSEHGMSALPMQMSACPWNAQHSRPGGWCGLQPARGRLSRSAVKACVQSTYVRHAGVPARVQVQYPDALARMQQDLVNIRIAARFLQARPSPNLTRLSLNSRGSALCRSRHLLVTLSRPARRRVRGPRTAAPGTRPAPDSGRARAAAGDGAPIRPGVRRGRAGRAAADRVRLPAGGRDNGPDPRAPQGALPAHPAPKPTSHPESAGARACPM